MKVALCIPSTDDWRADFAMSVAGLVQHAALHPAPNGQKIELRIFNMRFAYVTLSRNCMFREALAWKADWVLHIESDIYFPCDMLHELLKHDADCVGLNIVQRRALSPQPATPPNTRGQLAGMAWTGKTQHGFIPFNRVEVSALSFSFMLIRSELLRRMPTPWAEIEGQLDLGDPNHEASLLTLTLERRKPPMAHTPDDVVFCRKVRETGAKVYADMVASAKARHVGQARFGFNGAEFQEWMFTSPRGMA